MTPLTQAQRMLYIVIGTVAFLLLISAVFIVDQRRQVLVLQFGEPVRVVKKAGIHLKLPFIQHLETFDNRLLALHAKPSEVIASDQKRIIVDAFVQYKINDPLKFYQTVRSETVASQRLNTFLDSGLRQVLGHHPLSALLTGERTAVMQAIAQEVGSKAAAFGIEVVDVRIMRADLPQKNSESIFLRMQTEREREAKEFRAQGAEEGQRIRSSADKERTIILAEAEKKAEILRGEGDAESTRIFAKAVGQDPEFYAFYRSLQAYRTAMKKDDTSIVLSPNSEFLKYFGNVNAQ